jgi:hypothetical protein
MLSILPPLFVAFPLSTFLFVSQQVVIHALKKSLIYGRFVQFPNLKSNASIVFIDRAPTDFMLTISVLTAALACVSALCSWELRFTDHSVEGSKRQWTWAFANLIITLSNFAMVVACTVVTFLPDWDLDGDELKRGGKLVATREAWLCALERWNTLKWTKAGCGFARAGRWVLIPLGIFSLILVGLSIWQIGKRGGMKWLRKRGKYDELPEERK